MSATRNLTERPNGTTPMRASLAKPPHLPAPVQSASRRSSAQRGAVLLLALARALLAMPALAQTTRTYVSGKGSDANACTQAAPCLTLQAALAKTAASGQIYALDSANY